jgi:hypothetical protein
MAAKVIDKQAVNIVGPDQEDVVGMAGMALRRFAGAVTERSQLIARVLEACRRTEATRACGSRNLRSDFRQARRGSSAVSQSGQQLLELIFYL